MPSTPPPLLSSRRQVLGAGLLAALGSVAALELLGTARASAYRTPTPTSSTSVSVIGDSLTIGTLPYQADAFAEVGWGGTTIDAYGSRGIRTKMKSDLHTGLTAVDAIRAKAGDSELWVVALGSNDAGIFGKRKHADLINSMIDRIGTAHYVMWVNIYLPENIQRQQYWNTSLESVAADRPDEMFVFDWASVAGDNPRWMADDLVHYTGRGYSHRAVAIADATRSLIPPVPARPRRLWTQIPAA
jgi:lysophospholipase L1-like esterase